MYRVLPPRVGRRGTCLIGIALLYVIGGLTQYVQPPKTQVTMDQMHFLYAIAPPRVWAVGWMTVGVLALVGAFWPRVRSVAYAAVLALLGVWTIGVFAAAVTGAYRAFLAVALYGALLIVFQAIAGWPEAGHRGIEHWRDH